VANNKQEGEPHALPNTFQKEKKNNWGWCTQGPGLEKAPKGGELSKSYHRNRDYLNFFGFEGGDRLEMHEGAKHAPGMGGGSQKGYRQRKKNLGVIASP